MWNYWGNGIVLSIYQIQAGAIKCNDKDAPWITPNVKTAINRKHRVFKKFVDGGRREED